MRNNFFFLFILTLFGASCSSNKGYQNPLFSLKGFQRVLIEPGKSKSISFIITPDLMSSVNMNGDVVVEKGNYILMAGGASPGNRSVQLGMPGVVQNSFTIVEH